MRAFSGLREMSAAGDSVKDRIRQRLRAYDDVDLHPHLGDTSHVPEFRWRQYMLPDDQKLLEPDSCPFRVWPPLQQR
jgi:FPC/CPF motif-containing protein YcgG